MATAAEAAKEFTSGPQVPEAGRLLLSRFPLPVLCEALVNARPDDAQHLLAALERLADFEEVRASLLREDVVGFLREGAVAPEPRVRRLIARLLLELARGGEEGVTRLANAGLLGACEPLLLGEETGTAEAAAHVLALAVKYPVGLQLVVGAGGDDQGLLGRLQPAGDVERVRLLHLFVELGRSSQDAFAALEARGAYREVIGSFLTDDLLLKLNAVELMEALGSYRAGQELLSRQGLPEQLARELQDPMCDSSVRLCIARLLGLVLLRSPGSAEVLLQTREAPFPRTVAQLLESRDPAERLCALNAWANASAHEPGLAFFLSWVELLQEITALVASPQNEVCKGAMAAWASVLQTWPDLAPLWAFAEAKVLPLALKNLSNKPFADVREITWQLLTALAASRSCTQRMLPAEQMRELLLDFGSETASPARIAKHQFVQALSRHEWVSAFVDAEVAELLAEYARRGPHWVPRDAVAKLGGSSEG